MPTRTASVHWTGTLQDGSGQLSLESSHLGPYPVSFPTRAGDPDGQTSPEELIAGAHASCLAMNLSGVLAGEGLTADTIDISAEVGLGPDPDGGFRITGSPSPCAQPCPASTPTASPSWRRPPSGRAR